MIEKNKSNIVKGKSAGKVAIFYNTQQAEKIAAEIQKTIKADAHKSACKESMQSAFVAQKAIICIMASAIPIRILASLIRNKHLEPPVIAIDPLGKHISLLLGSDNGGYSLAKKISKILKISVSGLGAGRSLFEDSPDDLPLGWKWQDRKDAKKISIWRQEAINLAGEIAPPFGIPFGINKAPLNSKNPNQKTLYVGEKITTSDKGNENIVSLHPPILSVGIGARRGANYKDLYNLLLSTFKENNLAIESIATLTSIDAKADEIAIYQLQKKLKCDCRFFPPQELAKHSHNISHESYKTKEMFNIPSVAEASALAVAGKNAKIIVEKCKNKDATLAIVKAEQPLDLTNLTGIKRGAISIIGIGPGDEDLITIKAIKKLAQIEEVLGYKEYLKRIEHLAPQATFHNFEIGEEQKRAKKSISLAGKGKSVAVISSGDPAIYAMAGLVYEAQSLAKSPLERGVDIVTIPGITAAQAASAEVGALLGHDFVFISLSDLLTSKELIIERIKATVKADFVLAFYNPQSKTRRYLLKEAFNIIKQYRANPLVLIAKSVSSKNQELTLYDFNEITTEAIENIDMNTLVIVGSSTSKKYQSIKDIAYTPRGYKL